jgi:uncharacterized membrane protein YkvA (DUF1232 family)
MKAKFPSFLENWDKAAKALKSQTYALYLAYKHPLTPWYARILAWMVIAYAFCPIDLVPDFIPVLGYLDDLILIPLGIALVRRMIPEAVIVECQAQAEIESEQKNLTNWGAAVIIILIWGILAGLLMLSIKNIFASS